MEFDIRGEIKKLLSQQMHKSISFCSLKHTFCIYSTEYYCLNLRHCPYTKVKIGSFRRKQVFEQPEEGEKMKFDIKRNALNCCYYALSFTDKKIFDSKVVQYFVTIICYMWLYLGLSLLLLTVVILLFKKQLLHLLLSKWSIYLSSLRNYF